MIRFGEDICHDLPAALRREWLETNGLGGFASSTIIGLNTRRYHALLVAATQPPVGRVVLLSKLEETLVVGGQRYDLSANQYPGVVHPQGYQYLKEFRLDPFPVFRYCVDGLEIEKAVFLVHGENSVVVHYTIRSGTASTPRLEVRPLIAFRDYHSLTHENGALNAHVQVDPGCAVVAPYQGLPSLHVAHNAAQIDASGEWYRHFEYAVEQARGLDFVEDLFHPFTLSFDLAGTAHIIASTERRDASQATTLRRAEIERRERLVASVPVKDAPLRTLVAAADQYIVARGAEKSIIAGYPWFADWGRDTFIALRGLCLATGRLDVARDILLAWAGTVSEGMLPNRFPDHGEAPEFNSVDASLWYVIAVHDFLAAVQQQPQCVSDEDRQRLQAAIDAILTGYSAGTRFRIHLDTDGLLAAGQPGVQLTWMDAKVGDWVVTPRIGKPVEVQALWLNALHIGCDYSARWKAPLALGRAAFMQRFWNDAGGCLYDVVDVDHRAGTSDASFRPNQIFAVGGLPLVLLDDAHARRVVDAVEARLLTPLGLRSLAPGEPGYVPHYRGGVRERDGSYHQGTAWPWLLGPFVEAWIRVRGSSAAAKREARTRFLEPLWQHLSDAGIGHISEIADGDPPYTPAGCPFQAWSVGEALRLERVVLV